MPSTKPKPQTEVEIRPAVDLGQPCSKTETDGKVFCGPEVPGTREKADLVASFNVLISPSLGGRSKGIQPVHSSHSSASESIYIEPRNKEAREMLGPVSKRKE